MSFSELFPIFDKLTAAQQELLLQTASEHTVPRGTLLHNGSADCMGIMLIQSGQLRAYMTSEEGREITVYRLFERDMCLFSASCVMSSVQFEIIITAEKDTRFWLIPPHVFKAVMEQSAPMANYVNDVMATNFTDVMWLMEQVLWKSFDKRLAQFLLQEQEIEETPVLRQTHESIAGHLGTAREVVTRMLKYFQGEGMVRLTRGCIEITSAEKLEALAQG